MADVAPTERKRREARAAGQAAVSPLLSAAAALVAATAALVWSGAAAAARLAELARRAWSGGLAADGSALSDALTAGVRVAAPVLLAAFAGAWLVGVAQTRGLFALGAVGRRAGDDEALAPVGWLLAAALALAALIGLRTALAGLARATDLRSAATAFGAAAASLGPRLLLLFAAAGLGDLLWRNARLERALRMTRAEARAAEREEEGDPRLRAERRRRHRALAGSSLVDDLAAAQVLLAAEGLAVALRRDGDDVRVTAAGDGLMAARMVDLARRLGVRVRGDDVLIEALAGLARGDRVPPAHLARARATLGRG